MRNLKKVLSLALALVMLLGMMMVGAGAVDTGFKDDAGIKDDFKAAAAVTKALGVMEGDGTNLKPTANITRAEAFILSLRVDGSNTNTIAAKWPVTEKPFNDVSTGKWYASYLAYGKEMGLIAGSNGNYRPDEDITVVDYSVLLLGKLGFGEYTGANYTKAAKDAQDAGLYDGLGNVNYYSHKLTRQEACQMAFNALLYSPEGEEVTYKVTAVVTDEDDSTVLYIGSNKDVAYMNLTTAMSSDKYEDGSVKLEPVSVNVGSLGQKAFGLTRTTTATELGRTAVEYSAPRYRLLLEVVAPADYVFEGKVTNAALYATVGKDVADYTWTTKVDGLTLDANANAKPIKNDPGAFQGTKPGMITEVYVHEGTVDVLICNWYLGSVSKAVAAKGDADAYVMVNGMRYETEAFEKGDVVIYTREDKDIVSMQQAPEVTATLTKIVTKGTQTTYTIGGESYVMSATGKVDGLNTGALGKEITVYTDAQDNILAMKDAVKGANEYIYVVAHSAAVDNPDYITNTTYPESIEVYGVTNTGDVVKKNVVEINSKQLTRGTGDNTHTQVSKANDTTVAIAGLYQVVDSKGDSLMLSAKMVAQPKDDLAVNKPGVEWGTWSSGASPSFTKDANGDAVANSDTAFIFITQKSGTDKTITSVTVKTGIANIGTAVDKFKANLAIDGRTVEAVFVTNAFVDGNSNAVGVVYLKGNTEKKIDAWEDGKKVAWYTYECVDQTGDKMTLTSKEMIASYGGKVLEYDADDFLITNPALDPSRVFSQFVTSVKGSTIWLDSVDHSFNKTADTDVVFIDGDGADVAAGQQVVLVTASGDTNSKDHWNAQVVFVTGAGSAESENLRPVITEDDSQKTATVKPAIGSSFTVTGEQTDKVTVDIEGVGKATFTDWGKPAEVRGFAFQGHDADSQDYELNIFNADGVEMYKEKLTIATAANTGKYGGVFYVQVVNLITGQTTVSNHASSTGSLKTTELDEGDYSWYIVNSTSTGAHNGEIVAHGAFSITDNGD